MSFIFNHAFRCAKLACLIQQTVFQDKPFENNFILTKRQLTKCCSTISLNEALKIFGQMSFHRNVLSVEITSQCKKCSATGLSKHCIELCNMSHRGKCHNKDEFSLSRTRTRRTQVKTEKTCFRAQQLAYDVGFYSEIWLVFFRPMDWYW